MHVDGRRELGAVIGGCSVVRDRQCKQPLARARRAVWTVASLSSACMGAAERARRRIQGDFVEGWERAGSTGVDKREMDIASGPRQSGRPHGCRRTGRGLDSGATQTGAWYTGNGGQTRLGTAAAGKREAGERFACRIPRRSKQSL